MVKSGLKGTKYCQKLRMCGLKLTKSIQKRTEPFLKLLVKSTFAFGNMLLPIFVDQKDYSANFPWDIGNSKIQTKAVCEKNERK